MQRWGLVGTFRGNVCSHPLQWSDDAIHRPLGKRSVSHQATLECLPCEKSRHQTHGGSGVAAINVGGWRTEHSLFSMDDNCIGLRLIDPNPERAQSINGTHTIVAHEESIEAANSVGQRTDDGGAMRNALVPRHGDFRVDVRCAFDAKFHVNLSNSQSPQPWKEESSDIRRACPAARLFHPERSQLLTAPERSCWCRDLSLRFPVGTRERQHSPDWVHMGW